MTPSLRVVAIDIHQLGYERYRPMCINTAFRERIVDDSVDLACIHEITLDSVNSVLPFLDKAGYKWSFVSYGPRESGYVGSMLVWSESRLRIKEVWTEFPDLDLMERVWGWWVSPRCTLVQVATFDVIGTLSTTFSLTNYRVAACDSRTTMHPRVMARAASTDMVILSGIKSAQPWLRLLDYCNKIDIDRFSSKVNTFDDGLVVGIDSSSWVPDDVGFQHHTRSVNILSQTPFQPQPDSTDEQSSLFLAASGIEFMTDTFDESDDSALRD